jgi:hypothetical protein
MHTHTRAYRTFVFNKSMPNKNAWNFISAVDTTETFLQLPISAQHDSSVRHNKGMAIGPSKPCTMASEPRPLVITLAAGMSTVNIGIGQLLRKQPFVRTGALPVVGRCTRRTRSICFIIYNLPLDIYKPVLTEHTHLLHSADNV